MSQQLSECAFTVKGHAYELESEFKNRSVPWTVTAKCPSSSSWKTRLNAIGTSERANQIDRDAETKLPETDQASYIVIGVVPVLMPSDEDLMVLGARGRVGAELPKDPISPIDGMLALRVVTPKTLEPAPVKFYVLTDQEKPSNLCRPYNIGQDSVFYFSEYRTTTTKLSERKKQWNELIANYSVGNLQPAEVPALRSSLGPASVDEPAVAAAKEILMISSSYLYAEDSQEYHRLKNLLSSSDAGLSKFMTQMNRFLSVNAKVPALSNIEAEEMAGLIQARWPSMNWVRAERLVLLQAGMRDAETKIRFQDAYHLIGFGCFYLIENRDAKRFILELFPLLRSSGDIKSILNVNPSLQTKSLTGNLLKAVKLHIEDLHNLSLSVLRSIDERHGNMLIAIPPDAIHRRLGQAIDIDTIRGLFDQAMKYSMRDLQLQISKMRDISKKQLDLLQGLVTALDAPK